MGGLLSRRGRIFEPARPGAAGCESGLLRRGGARKRPAPLLFRRQMRVDAPETGHMARRRYTLQHDDRSSPPILTSSSPPAPATQRGCWWTNCGRSVPTRWRRPGPGSPSPAPCDGLSSLSLVPGGQLGALAIGRLPGGRCRPSLRVVGSICWRDHLGRRGTLAVEVTSAISRGPLAQVNTHYAEQRVKDAIADQFRAKTGVRPSVDLCAPTSGQRPPGAGASDRQPRPLRRRLHRRGYRLKAGPLRSKRILRPPC